MVGGGSCGKQGIGGMVGESALAEGYGDWRKGYGRLLGMGVEK